MDLAVDRADALTLRHPLGGIEQMLDSQAFGLAFLFLLFSKNAFVLSGFPDDLCASFGVVWIDGS